MRPKVSMLTPGADCFVVAVKLGNASGSEGGRVIRFMIDSLRSTGNGKKPFDLNEGRSSALRWMTRAV